MTGFTKLLLLSLMMVAGAGAGFAQVQAPNPDAADGLPDVILEEPIMVMENDTGDFDNFMRSDNPSPTDPFIPNQAVLDILEEDGKAALKASLIAAFEYRTNGFEHRTRVFNYQYQTSKVIFGMVILIVAMGMYFSWMQFRQNPQGDGADSSIELGTTGIKVTSPVLGVIILALSLGFFYLYLVHVYPIFDTF